MPCTGSFHSTIGNWGPSNFPYPFNSNGHPPLTPGLQCSCPLQDLLRIAALTNGTCFHISSLGDAFECLESEAVVSLNSRRGGAPKPPYEKREVPSDFGAHAPVQVVPILLALVPLTFPNPTKSTRQMMNFRNSLDALIPKKYHFPPEFRVPVTSPALGLASVGFGWATSIEPFLGTRSGQGALSTPLPNVDTPPTRGNKGLPRPSVAEPKREGGGVLAEWCVSPT